MDSGVPLAPSFATTPPPPMMFTHFMGMAPSTLHYGMQNYNTQSMPWAYNHFSNGMLNMSSHVPSSVNPSCGSGGMMPPYYPFLFGGSHIPQTPLAIGGWNIPSYESSVIGASSQMGVHSTYYTPPTYPYSTMSVPKNTFPMVELCLVFSCSI
jgi:hypothetical protein